MNELVPVEPKEKVDNHTKKICLESAIRNLIKDDPFHGIMLQCINIKYTEIIPTAAITFNPKASQYEVMLNPNFFCGLEVNQRVAVLFHEILHFTNKHLFRLPFLTATPEDRKLYNIAGDMSINQYIRHLPDGCVDVKMWKMDDGNQFPLLKSMEEYYNLLKTQTKNNKKTMDGYKEFDQHMWDALTEEEKETMLKEAKKLIQRTIEKSVYAHSTMPEHIKDLLNEIETLATGINYRNLLKKAIKKTISAMDRDGTWVRPNKRYGVMAKGTKLGALPSINQYADTSGSISRTELNAFLNVMSGFLKAGTKKCMLGLWHTELYYKKQFRLNSQIAEDALQSGGTCVESVIKDINKALPNLSIILTDGYYEDCKIKPKAEIIWVISKGGNKEHPMKQYGKTILLDKIL